MSVVQFLVLAFSIAVLAALVGVGAAVIEWVWQGWRARKK